MTIAVEECGEVAQRITKCMRFGLDETQTGHEKTNKQRVYYEFCDLLGVLEMLDEEGIIPRPTDEDIQMMKALKKEKIEKYLKYSKEQGTLTK